METTRQAGRHLKVPDCAPKLHTAKKVPLIPLPAPMANGPQVSELALSMTAFPAQEVNSANSRTCMLIPLLEHSRRVGLALPSQMLRTISRMLPHTGAIATMVTFAWKAPLRRPPLQSKKVMSAQPATTAQLEPLLRSPAHQAIDSLTLNSPHASAVHQEHTVVHSVC